MRLSSYELKMIQKAFFETFQNGKIYLFGSRVDDNKKGGDIDLYIIPKYKNRAKEDESKFLIKLYEYLGEQKIDIILAKDKNRLIEQEAIKNGVDLMDNKIRLQRYLNECNKHKIRIEKSYNKTKNIFPLSSTKYENLNDEEIEAIDQYLFRFAKLQDTLGERVFKLIISEYVDNIYDLTFIDILNYLEKIGILKDVNIWKKLRKIRNDISHQYDDEPDEMAEALNNIFAYKDELLDILENIEKWSKEKIK